MPAGQREEVPNPLSLQRLRDKVSAVSGLFQRRDPGGKSGGYRNSPADDHANRGQDWRGYDAIAETYERVFSHVTGTIARDLVALAAPPAGARVLDVGTGTGVTARAAEEAIGDGAVVVGIDPSVEMLRTGRVSRPGLRIALGEAIDLPFRDGTFDVVTANFVLSHFKDYRTALFDIIRVLKPRGRLAATAWTQDTDEFKRAWRELAEGVAGPDLLNDALRRAMPWEERFSDKAHLDETLRDAGLGPVRVEQRQYRFTMPREDYIQARENAALGRFLREMLGERGWESFRERTRVVFAERFPDPLTDFRDVLLAIGTKRD
jgi:ubiquinone/menaquinone biosynthesis C-methylase UbiE